MSNRIYYSQDSRQAAIRRQLIGALALIGVGFCLGVGLALLFAPDEGEKTRELIANALEKGVQQGLDTM